MMPLPAAIVTDIEGTTTPIRFVHDELFPYARLRLAGFLQAQGSDPEIAATLVETLALKPGIPPLQSLLAWMDEDAKVTPLKKLQGRVWRHGYEAGELRGALYPDVAPALAQWHAGGTKLHVYSSGSQAAQHLLFRHSVAGDLAPLFGYFFDTTTGPKQEAASYRLIAQRLALPSAEILFLSDVEAELDAAGEAGFMTCQLVRQEDGTVPSDRHRNAPDFHAVTQFCF